MGCDDIRTARKRSFFWKKERRVLNVLCVGSAHSYTEHAPFFCSCGTDHTFENLQGQHIDLSGGNAADGSARES